MGCKPKEQVNGNVKKVMKKHSGRQRKTTKSLPLEGEGTCEGERTEGRIKSTPHPDPLPQGERGDDFWQDRVNRKEEWLCEDISRGNGSLVSSC
jgi:hypothetical protein